MKKLLFAGLLALGLVLTSQQQASAWSKWSFSAGISLNYEGGNNSFLWGLSQSGQVPGYPTDVWPANKHGFQGGYPAGDFGYGYGGGYPITGDHAAMPSGPALPGNGQGQPTGSPQQPKQATTQAVYYSGYNYQPAANYYQAPNYGYQQYGYSNYGYGNYQVPSYWYGR